MNVKELMIDDWVLYDNEPHKIQGVSYGEVTIECWPKDEGDIEPIPITTEILEKNGFVNEEVDPDELLSYFRWDNGDIHVSIYNNFNYISDLHIHHVHELQHALRLCGIEKEIIL